MKSRPPPETNCSLVLYYDYYNDPAVTLIPAVTASLAHHLIVLRVFIPLYIIFCHYPENYPAFFIAPLSLSTVNIPIIPDALLWSLLSCYPSST